MFYSLVSSVIVIVVFSVVFTVNKKKHEYPIVKNIVTSSLWGIYSVIASFMVSFSGIPSSLLNIV